MGSGGGDAGAIGAVVGAVVQAGVSAYNTSKSIAADALESGRAFKRQKVLDELSYQRSRRFRRTAHQDTTLDLERAGLNRILSVSRGATGSNLASPSSAPHASGTGSRGVTAGAMSAEAIGRATQLAADLAIKRGTAKQLKEQTKGIKTETQIKELDLDLRKRLLGIAPSTAAGLAALALRNPAAAAALGVSQSPQGRKIMEYTGKHRTPQAAGAAAADAARELAKRKFEQWKKRAREAWRKR